MAFPADPAGLRAALRGATSSELVRSRRAAVALVLRGEDAELSVLLVRRSERPGDPWSGHMAFPGGHAEASDVDLLHTARRETREEVGLDLERAELLGTLNDVTPLRSSQLAVRPFVFWLAEPRELRLSSEIAETLWVPLRDLAEPARRTSREIEIAATPLRVPAYVVGGRVVWGMTLRLLDDFLARIARGG